MLTFPEEQGIIIKVIVLTEKQQSSTNVEDKDLNKIRVVLGTQNRVPSGVSVRPRPSVL